MNSTTQHFRDLFSSTTDKPKVLNLYGQMSNARKYGCSAKTAHKQMVSTCIIVYRKACHFIFL